MEMTITLPALLTQEQLCQYLGKSEAWRSDRGGRHGAALRELGRHVRYRAEDVERWVAAGLRTSTSGEAT